MADSSPPPPRFEIDDASGMKGWAERVLAPSSAVELASFVQAAALDRIPLTISGAGTGVTGGRVPDGGWLLSLEKLDGLRVEPGLAVAGAGVLLKDLHAAAQRSGQFYPPDPTEWAASVGGSVSTNASGSRSFLYGSTRRWVRALTVCLADGTLRRFSRGERVDFPFTPLPAPRARKQTAGYWLRPDLDWVDLFIGSEGTLGIVVEAELALLPAPEALLAGVVFFSSEAEGLAAVDSWRAIPQLRMLEWMDRESVRLLRARYPEIPARAQAAVLIEHLLDGLPGDPLDEWVERMETAGALEDSWFGETAQDRERFRVFRHALPEIVNDRVRQAGFQKMSTDFAVPVGRGGEMMAFYRERLDELFPGKSVLFGHIGDAHVHVNLLPETEDDVRRGRDLIEAFARRAVALGGTVSAEHGLGKKKSWMLPLEFSEAQIEAMREVKRRLDPHWLLGRGTLFSGAAR